MIIVAPAVIVRVNHSQMASELVDEAVHVAGKRGVTGVKTDSYFSGVNAIKNPQDVARVAKEEVRQFVFKHAHDAEFFAALSHFI
jgi:hypothetical protein